MHELREVPTALMERIRSTSIPRCLGHSLGACLPDPFTQLIQRLERERANLTLGLDQLRGHDIRRKHVRRLERRSRRRNPGCVHHRPVAFGSRDLHEPIHRHILGAIMRVTCWKNHDDMAKVLDYLRGTNALHEDRGFRPPLVFPEFAVIQGNQLRGFHADAQREDGTFRPEHDVPKGIRVCRAVVDQVRSNRVQHLLGQLRGRSRGRKSRGRAVGLIELGLSNVDGHPFAILRLVAVGDVLPGPVGKGFDVAGQEGVGIVIEIEIIFAEQRAAPCEPLRAVGEFVEADADIRIGHIASARVPAVGKCHCLPVRIVVGGFRAIDPEDGVSETRIGRVRGPGNQVQPRIIESREFINFGAEIFGGNAKCVKDIWTTHTSRIKLTFESSVNSNWRHANHIRTISACGHPG